MPDLSLNKHYDFIMFELENLLNNPLYATNTGYLDKIRVIAIAVQGLKQRADQLQNNK
jgi:hypothetical protein